MGVFPATTHTLHPHPIYLRFRVMSLSLQENALLVTTSLHPRSPLLLRPREFPCAESVILVYAGRHLKRTHTLPFLRVSVLPATAPMEVVMGSFC